MELKYNDLEYQIKFDILTDYLANEMVEAQGGNEVLFKLDELDRFLKALGVEVVYDTDGEWHNRV